MGSVTSASGETSDAIPDEHCSLDATVSCVDKSGEDCAGLMIRQGDCSLEDVTFEFNFCNMHPTRGLETMKGSIEVFGNSGFSEAFTEEYIDASSCVTVKRKVSVKNCANSIGASIELHGWFKDESNAWDTCDTDDMYKVIRKQIPETE